jgi:HAT1-interacting factor 1
MDLFGKAIEVEEDEGGQGDEDEDEEEEGDGEPEDDFNAAWEVLDLARAIYDKQVADDGEDEVKLKLADTYIALGDVSLETGNAIFSSHQQIVFIFVQKSLIKLFRITKLVSSLN